MRISTILTVLTISLICVDANAQESGVTFNDDIRPLLSEYCFACHGPDSASRKADLRLDQEKSAKDGIVIVPGNSKKSELVRRILSNDPDDMMPPPGSKKKMKPEEKKLLVAWIEAGAEWQEHWAFIKPAKPQLPQPQGIKEWAKNPIDHFLKARLDEFQLAPNKPADRNTIARRVALDLTGLPPDPKLLDQFIADKAPGAYGRYVAALFKSQHAGEHRARFWLDAARYGDTHGMHVDNYREIWPYRDWVIQAFNSNMPFNQFVIEQIAGDLLPKPTLDQRIATGFNRCNITTSEGGAIPEELDVRYMVDRVETTSTVFLGLTAGCAVCHDHKYDPISQREFYQLGAFFNNTTQPAMDGNQKDTPPVVALPNDDFKKEWSELQSKRAQLSSELKKSPPAVEQWWTKRAKQSMHPVADDALALWLPLTEGEGEAFDLPSNASWATKHPAGKRGIRFNTPGGFSRKFAQVRSDQPISVSFWFRTPDKVFASISLFDQSTSNKDKKAVGWKINSNSRGDLSFEMHDGKGNKIRGLLPDNEALVPKTWQHVCVRYSGGQSNSSISILANGRTAALRNSSENLIEAADLADIPLKIASSLPTAGLSDIRIFRRWVSDDEVQLLANDLQIKRLLASETKWDQLNPKDRSLLTSYYRQAIDADYRKHALELASTETRRDYIYGRSTTTLVMQERPTRPRAFVLERGEYNKRGEEVVPAVPAVLNFDNTNAGKAAKVDSTLNRRDLANWLVHPDHPLTARVMVNRMWQSVFGTGLVKTSEDFGVMGDAPSHPKLLDWLAVEFIKSGWDVNHIMKLMVTSAAYRQSSVVTDEKLQKDPANRMLSRGPRLRLDAEVLRDQALAVSGLLKRQIGGASVRPYQPGGLWNVVAITGSNTAQFKRDSGDALYRRSLYTFWKRTSPPPSMAAFNAPTREQCTVRRERTNTPLQALVLMNDPQYVESARHLAAITLRNANDDATRIAWMYRQALSRPISDEEKVELTGTVGAFRDLFKKDTKAATALITTGESKPDEKLDAAELASWTMIANVIMNRDDFINKE